jgi:pseudaminic acid synthase
MKKPYFIAEISANHVGSLKIAKNLIKIAKYYGADAVKLQTYTADSMTLNSNKKDFLVSSGLWKGEKLWNLYDKAKTPYEWHSKLFAYAKKLKITCFSTPFDSNAVDLLEKLKCPFYKISSFEMNDFPLIEKVLSTKKPLILSTGTSSLKEIKTVMRFIKKKKSKNNVSLLYCVSNYPASYKDFNLNNISILKKEFNCTVGLSDHSTDNKVAIAAIGAGAEIFEKHIAIKDSKKSPDFKFSLLENQIGEYRKCLNETYEMFKKNKFYRNKSEKFYKNFRRSIYVIKNIKKGDLFTENNIKLLRPAKGIGPEYYKKIINKRSYSDISAETSLKKSILIKLKIK